MRDTLSTDYGSSESYPTVPYRPGPKARKRSPELQRESHIRELASSIASLCSLRYGARIVVVITQFVYFERDPDAL